MLKEGPSSASNDELIAARERMKQRYYARLQALYDAAQSGASQEPLSNAQEQSSVIPEQQQSPVVPQHQPPVAQSHIIRTYFDAFKRKIDPAAAQAAHLLRQTVWAPSRHPLIAGGLLAAGMMIAGSSILFALAGAAVFAGGLEVRNGIFRNAQATLAKGKYKEGNIAIEDPISLGQESAHSWENYIFHCTQLTAWKNYRLFGASMFREMDRIEAELQNGNESRNRNGITFRD